MHTWSGSAPSGEEQRRVAAWLLVAAQGPPFVVAYLLTALALASLWFIVYVGVFGPVAVALGIATHRASQRMHPPVLPWTAADALLNLALLVVGVSLWVWALSISLADLDSRQVLAFSVGVAWMAMVATAIVLMVRSMRPNP